MNWKILVIALLLLSQFACRSKMTEAPDLTHTPLEEKESSHVHPLVSKITRVLQPGWEVSQNGDTIQITRKEPVRIYGNVAMPPLDDMWAILQNEEPIMQKYQITIEIKPRVSRGDYRKIQQANKETDRKLSLLTYAMDDFQGKGDYHPRNEREKELYEDYRKGLRELPFQQLPDLYDESNSFYISTTLHSRTSFVYAREERECRAVLANIFSFADGYEDFTNATAEDEYFTLGGEDVVDKVFRSSRVYDYYLVRREDNLPEFRPALPTSKPTSSPSSPHSQP